MKILIVSVNAIVDSRAEALHNGIENALDSFLKMDSNNRVLVISAKGTYLDLVPKRFNPTHISFSYRKSGLVSLIINKYPEYSKSNFIILGCKDDDFQLAVNEKVLLLYGSYASQIGNCSQIKKYGIPIISIDALRLFFSHYLTMHDPWYFKLNVTARTTLLCLTNANTYTVGDEVRLINNHFQQCLKSGVNNYKESLLIYFLMSLYSSEYADEFRKVDFWTIYPSSGIDLNTDLHSFVEVARILFKGKPQADNREKQILIRKKATFKRHKKNKNDRIVDGCSKQFDTIQINEYYKKNKKLKGKTVCILDDYSTYGTSCETARALLSLCGVAKIFFISIGKFGLEYYQYSYLVSGNPYGEIKYLSLSLGSLRTDYTINLNSNKEMIHSLSNLL